MMNPVLMREIRTKVRDWRSPLLLAGYAGALGVVVLLYFHSQLRGLLQGYLFGPEIGLGAYSLLTYFQLLMIAFIVPAVSSAAISGEKERQTFDLLWCTRLNARSIILGKLMASVAYTLLAIAATIPLYSIIFFFGGLAPNAILLTFLVYLASAITFSAISILCSTIVKRTTVATVLAYTLVFVLLVGTVVVAALQYNAVSRKPPDPQNPWVLPPKVLYFNPLVGISSVIPDNSGGSIMSLFGAGSSLRPQLRYHPNTPSSTAVSTAQPYTPPPAPKLAPAWQYNLLCDAGITAGALALSIALVNPAGPFSKIRRKSR